VQCHVEKRGPFVFEAFGGEGGRLRRVPYPSRQREQNAAGAPRRTAALPELPCNSERGQCTPQPAELPDARRLHTLPLQHSRLELRRQFSALRTGYENHSCTILGVLTASLLPRRRAVSPAPSPPAIVSRTSMDTSPVPGAVRPEQRSTDAGFGLFGQVKTLTWTTIRSRSVASAASPIAAPS